ncbi:MAG TPA: tetratricopeptide repeat protein [Dongiaceae bacterium]|jgi:tetratricopeptide (TPR) repeat protein|nr:tetratricopeptide repeat protein [Dongiaceae bacterium]
MVRIPVNRRLAGAVVAFLALAFVWISSANAAGFGADDRVDRHRVKGSVYGAIGLVVHEDGLSTEAGTGFLVSPCHVMTAYHVVAGKEKLKTTDTAMFYVGEGRQGPDYPGGKAYQEGTEAHPVVWGNFLDGESDNMTIRVKAVQSNGWQDWVLLKLDKCLGDPANGWGYLRLKPIATRDLTRSGETLAAAAVGLPKDKNERTLTEDPSCRIIGQMSESGWQHDCITLPGNSGGPVLERAPSDGKWPEVLGITVSLILLDGMDQEDAEAALLSADDPSYFSLLSTAVPVSAFINKVAQYLPPDPVVTAYIADHRLDTGYSAGDDIDYDGALADYDQAVKAHPADAELLLRRGLWQAADNKADAAIDDYTAALKIEPGYPAALLSRSQSFSDRDDHAKHDLDNAIADLTTLIGRFSDSAELRLNRAYFYSRDHQMDAAIGDFTAFLKMRPKSSSAFRARASAYAELHRFDLATHDYDRAVDIDPDQPASYIARGNFRSQIGQESEALADFDKALQLYPAAADAYSGRAYVFIQQGKLKQAVAAFDKALTYDEKASYVLGGRASAYQIIGDHESALRDYAKAVEYDPSEPFIKLLWLVEQGRAGKVAEARQGFAEFAADTRYGDWPRAIAQCLAGEIDSGALERIAETGSDYDKQAHAFDRDFYLGQAALIAGDAAGAKKRLQAVVDSGDRQYIEYNIAAADLAKLTGSAAAGSGGNVSGEASNTPLAPAN